MLQSKKHSHKQSWVRNVLRTVQPRPKSLILKKPQRLIQAVEPDKKRYEHAAGIKIYYSLVNNWSGAAKKALTSIGVINSHFLDCINPCWPTLSSLTFASLL